MNKINIIYGIDLDIPDGVDINVITYTKEEIIKLEDSVINDIIYLINKHLKQTITTFDIINGNTDNIDTIVNILITLFMNKYDKLVIYDESISLYLVEFYNLLIDICLDINSDIYLYTTDIRLISEIELDIHYGLFPDFISIYTEENKNELLDYMA